MYACTEKVGAPNSEGPGAQKCHFLCFPQDIFRLHSVYYISWPPLSQNSPSASGFKTLKEEGLYQNKVNYSLVCARNCKMDYSIT